MTKIGNKNRAIVEVPIKSNPKRGMYLLLIKSETMEYLKEIPDYVKSKIKQILLDLSSGEWENWQTFTKPNFISYKEQEGHRELFTLYLPELKSSLIWERIWSVDLVSRVQYPLGTYGDEDSQSRIFAAHVIISFLEIDKPLPFKFSYNDINYEQQDGLNENQDFWQLEQTDQLDYKEEYYLLATNVIEDILNGVQQGLPLQMSDEQVKVLTIDGPILVSGEAGSGKTIIIVHWLMINHLKYMETEYYKEHKRPIEQLFVTYSDRLRDNAKKNFKTMLPKTCLKNETHFRTFRELITDIAKEGGILNEFPKEKEMTFEIFMKKYPKGQFSRKVDPVLLWDEIRSVIKGRTSELQSIIDLPSYKELSEKHEQCKIPKDLREDYYRDAQKYQNYLQNMGFWDEIDFVKACIPYINEAKKYDKIACDEVQDLAPNEIGLITRLVKNGDIKNIFLTGDEAQVINPSGFKWSQVKEILYKASDEKISDVYHLEKNYRSCKEIVDLVNSVLSVRKKLLDDEVSKLHREPSEALLKRRFLPMMLSGKWDDLLNILNTIKSDPDKRLILLKTVEEKNKILEKIGEAINYNTLLTIEEAKGLEFDGTLLWNFFIPRHPEITKNDWEKIFIPDKRKKMIEEIQNEQWKPYGLTYEFNLLHVGLTRSRNGLFIFDDEQHQKMTLTKLDDELENRIKRGDLNAFQTTWKTGKPSGDSYLNVGQRLLDRDTEQAYRFFKLAAKIFSEKGNFVRAAYCQEQAKDYDAACGLYKAANDKENELRVLGIKFRENELYDEAGDYFRRLAYTQIDLNKRTEASSNFEVAKTCYLMAKPKKQKTKAAESSFQSADCLPDQLHSEKATKFQNAAYCYKDDDNLEEAIRTIGKSITEAKDAQESGSNDIAGNHIDYWVAQRYIEIAEYEMDGNRNNTQDSASAASKAANLIKGLQEHKEEFEAIPNNEKLIKFREDALTLSIELYIKSNQIIKSTTFRKELLKLIENKGDVEVINSRWKKFAELYSEQKEFDDYAETILELTTVLKKRKDRRAITHLNEALRIIEKSPNPKKRLFELADELDRIAKTYDAWNDIAEAHKVCAKIKVEDEEYTEAWYHFKEVGKALVMARSIDADKYFRIGIEQLSKDVKEIKLGEECFFEIVLNSYAKIPEFYDPILKNWLAEAATYLAQDIDRSMGVLEKHMNKKILEKQDYLKKLKEETEPVTIKKLEEELIDISNEQGWVAACIGQVKNAHIKTSGDKSTKEMVDTWFKKAISSFEETKNLKAIEVVKKLWGHL